MASDDEDNHDEVEGDEEEAAAPAAEGEDEVTDLSSRYVFVECCVFDDAGFGGYVDGSVQV